MVKTRSEKIIHKLCDKKKKGKKKKTISDSAKDKVTSDRTNKTVGKRKSERNIVITTSTERMRKHRENKKNIPQS